MIEILDDVTINKIAAGEVIERPSSALKELLENSFDSGATQIEVSFSDGGKELLKVKDNGSGIKKEELPLALTRHATSKLKSIDDLNKIQTLGFRGEALASMASVSELVITSVDKNQKKAALLKAQGGHLLPLEPAALSAGTTVEVKNLFYNVPARLKFLKSSNAETAAIKKVFKNFALIHPEIHLTLKQDQKNILVYPKTDFLSRACEVMEVSKNDCFYIKTSEDQMQLEAVLVHPKLNASSLSGLYIFAQNRPIQDKLITQAVIEGYRNLVMEHQFPQGVISLKVDPHFIDVNTHPAKLQVKFQNPSIVFKFVNQSIKNTFEVNLKNNINPVRFSLEETFSQQAFTAVSQAETFFNQKSFQPAEVINIVEQAEPIKETKVHTWSSMQVIGQFANTYILAHSQKGLIIIDQHAAHERVLFERLKSKTQMAVQPCLIEQLVELSPEKVEVLLSEPLYSEITKLGFEYHQRGSQHIAITALPSFLTETSMSALFERLAEEAMQINATTLLDDFIADVWASMSCHGAIRAGKVLSKEEMQTLLVQMEESSFSSFCPHGRPVSVLLTHYDLEKLFKRIV